jgi:CHAT domain-containing protein
LLAQLGQKLLAAFWDEFRDAEALIIVPHGPLHAIPFQALRVDGQYLIERQAVSYAPSAAILKYCWDKTPHPDAAASPGSALLVGVPDEVTVHITAEIEALAELLEAPQILVGKQATHEALRRSVPHCEIIHLAAHGLFRPDAPLLSSIHLADHWLTVQDVYDLELNATLVALSACETGLGKDAGGDDLIGLVRGFIHAGARALLVSQWTVDDQAMTELVVGFYRQWLSGASKAEALRKAQITLLNRYEHPYYWAPLVLNGDER